MNSKALNQWRWKVFGIVCLVVMQGVLAPVASQANAAGKAERPRQETASQQVLRKVMEDIRHCDKTVRYEYDPKSGRINPPELGKIKGLKLKKLLKNELAVFSIDETYEGMHTATIWMIQANGAFKGEKSLPSVAFWEDFQSARKRLESVWNVQFVDGLRPGDDELPEGQYADVVIKRDGERRFLSVERMPLDVYPHIGFTDVGCNYSE